MDRTPDMEALSRLVPVTAVKVGPAIVPTCNARELHAYLEVKRDFSSWIKGRIAKYGFVEDVDFAALEDLRSPDLVSSKSRTQRVKEYHLALDMAKELGMVENNPMGRTVRRYFIECERRSVGQHMATIMAPRAIDPAWAEWLSLSTDERRTRQKDVQIDRQLYGSPGGRHTSYQVGRPVPPRHILTAAQQHELELAGQGVTVTVVVPNGSTH